MPDAQNNYLGDQATVLPDNTQNIIHYADQYQAANQRRAMLRQKQAEDDQRRNESYLKLIGDAGGEIDNTDNNAGQKLTSDSLANLKSQEIKNYQNSVRKGIPINEADLRDRLNSAVTKISNTHNAYVNKEQETNDAIASYAKIYGIDHDKLKGLSKLELNYSTDPKTGKTSLDPNKLNDNRNTSYVVKNVLEDNFDTIATGQGVGENFAKRLGEGKGKLEEIQPVYNKQGAQITPGFTAKKMDYQEYTKDANGNPTGLQVRQVPAVTSDGTVVKNPDGSTKMTIAPDLAKTYLDDIGQSANLKKDSYHAILDENKKRLDINERNSGVPGFKPMQMITGNSDEAHAIQNDLILKKYQEGDQGGEFRQAKDETYNHWEKRLSDMRADYRMAQTDRRIADQENKTAAATSGKSGGSLLNAIADKSADIIKVPSYNPENPMGAQGASVDQKVIYMDKMDNKTAANIIGHDPNKGLPTKNKKEDTRQFIPFTDKDGRDFVKVQDNGDWSGTKGLITASEHPLTKGNHIDIPAPAPIPDKKPNMIQRGIQKVKDAVTGKGKTTIAKGSL
jgi:hypothetical protein